MAVKVTVILSLLGLAIVFGVYEQMKKRAAWEVKVERLEAIRDSLETSVQDLTSAVAEIDTIVQEKVDTIIVEVERLEGQATEAAGQFEVILQDLETSIREEFKPVLVQLQIQHMIEIRAVRDITTQKESIIGLLEQRILARDTLITSQRVALSEANLQIDFWQEQARPGFIKRMSTSLPFGALILTLIVVAVK